MICFLLCRRGGGKLKSFVPSPWAYREAGDAHDAAPEQGPPEVVAAPGRQKPGLVEAVLHHRLEPHDGRDEEPPHHTAALQDRADLQVIE
jgi:hypothetical protein